MIKNVPNVVKFGSLEIKESQIFYYRKHVFAFVNLRPFVPGHVLVCPTRCEMKYKDLSETEAIELWVSAKKIADNIKKFYNTDSVQLTIQDGEDAGQTINHCHIHIIPVTKRVNIDNLDAIDRKDRSEEDMVKEAELYRLSFNLN